MKLQKYGKSYKKRFRWPLRLAAEIAEMALLDIVG